MIYFFNLFTIILFMGCLFQEEDNPNIDSVLDVPTLVMVSDSIYETQEGKELKFSVRASLSGLDSLLDSIEYFIEDLPEGAKFKDSTFTWWPNFLSAGTHILEIKAISPEDTATQVIQINVQDSLVSYALKVQPIFDGQCIECHNPNGNGYTLTGGDDYNGLDLTSRKSWEAMVNKPTYQIPDYSPQYRILPGDTAESYIIQKCDPQLKPKFGEIMPWAGYGGLVEPYNLAILKAWVMEGALNN